jgi:hypothetical protein
LLRLIYAAERTENESGNKVIGYLLVLTPQIKKTVTGWVKNYAPKSEIKIVFAELSGKELNNLQNEKVANVRGMTDGGDDANASYGGELGESKLKECILKDFPKTKQTEPIGLAFGSRIQWDYFGVAE